MVIAEYLENLQRRSQIILEKLSRGEEGLQGEFDSGVPYTEDLRHLIENFPAGFHVRMTESEYIIRHIPCGLFIKTSAYEGAPFLLAVLQRHTETCPASVQTAVQADKQDTP